MREARAMFLVRISIGQFMLEVKVGATSQRATTRTAPCSSCLARVRGGVGEGGKGRGRGGRSGNGKILVKQIDGWEGDPSRYGVGIDFVPMTALISGFGWAVNGLQAFA